MQNEIVVQSSFEGARLGSSDVAGNTVYIELLYDEPVVADWNRHDYRLHFTFGVENRTEKEQKVRIRVTGGDREDLPYGSPLIFSSSQALSGYRRIEVDGASDQYNTYDFDVIISARETLYLANCLPRFLSRLMPMFDKIGQDAGAEREIFGHSIEKRELIAYKFLGKGDDRPVVLVSSGIHPPEPDTLATEALIEFLGSDESAQLRKTFDFVIVPVMNPDGYAHGSQAGNAAGINFYWDFRYQDRSHCPEAAALYDYAMKLKPVLYFDFHAYTFQLRKHASPYCKPVRRYRGEAVRKVVQDSYDRVREKVSKGHGMYSFGTYAPSTLGEILTRKLNTIGYAKYHIHLKDGEQACREHAVAAVKTVCETLIDHQVTHVSDILVAPDGAIPKEMLGEVRRKLDIYWSGLLFPKLYGIYNRYFRKYMRRTKMDRPDAYE